MRRAEADQYIEHRFAGILKPSARRQFCVEVFEKFNIPIDRTMDMLMFRRNVQEYKNFEVFAYVSSLDKNKVKDFFTEEEIKFLSSADHEEKGVTFPITFDGMIQISNDQWIGGISLQRMMELRDAQMINYREGQQRTLKRVMSGGIETFHIAISKNNVREIEDLFKRQLYIPDDITLNMPVDGSEFKYNKTNRSLTIFSLPNNMFDILDAYHRYLAMSNIHNQFPDFDYPMELRITYFPPEKAQQFIYQKDQKTRMAKSKSDTYNQYSVENRILRMINQDPNCLIAGKIGSNSEDIDMSRMAIFIRKWIVPSAIPQKEENRIVLEAKTKLLPRINKVVSEMPELMSHRWTIKEMFCVMYTICQDKVSENQYVPVIKYLLKNFESDKMTDIVSQNYVRIKAVNSADELVERWKEDV